MKGEVGKTDKVICALCGMLLGCMMVFPGEAASAAAAALRLWALSIVPVLCPYLFLMLLLSSRLRLPLSLQIPLGWLCGSPGGAKLMQRQNARGDQVLRLAALSGTMSPMFFLSTLSSWLQSRSAGQFLLVCHLLGALLTGLTVRKAKPPKDTLSKAPLHPLRYTEAIRESITAMPGIGLCMMLGSITAQMVLRALPELPAGIIVLLQCLLEITAGAKALIDLSPPLLLPLLSAACAFAGASILIQNAAFWRESGVTILRLMDLRLRHALFSGILAYLAARFLL